MDNHPNNCSSSPQPTQLNTQEWILDSTNFHRVWAKYEDERWTYADQEGNLVDKPEDGDTKPACPHQRSSAEPWTKPRPSNGRREKVTYQGVYEEEEGELAHHDLDRGRRQNRGPKAVPQDDADDQEEGELDSIEEALLDFHDSIPAPEPPRPFPIRLLALPKARASTIDPNRNLLILQPGVDEPMVLGRDRTFEPSLRLKEMEVSKTHATFFWRADGEHAAHGWHIVDNASTHGTFISPSSDAHHRATPNRLSKARKASLPYKLNHLDTIMIASDEDPVLSFQVHLHPRFPSSCQACALLPDESNRMSLESQQPVSQDLSKIAEIREEERYAMSPADVKLERERKRKIEMAKLRNQFFGDEAEPASKKQKKPDRPDATTNQQPADEESGQQPEPKQYLDRAKLRRQTHGRCAPLAPIQTTKPSHVAAGPSRIPETQEPEPMRRGAAMLAKLGGNPDSLKSMGTLIQARTLGSSQAGLGSRELVVGVENIGRPKDWREEAKLANWRRYGPAK